MAGDDIREVPQPESRGYRRRKVAGEQSSSPGYLRILIYFFPALVDMVAAQFLFINTVRVAKMGASASVSAGITTVWSVTYLVACLAVGRLATPLNSARLMLVSCLSLGVLAGLFMIVPGIAGMYALTAAAGVAAALFFPPFQVFMKAVDQGGRKPLCYSIGLYTFAWSIGYATGPFVAGFLMEQGVNGWRLAYVFAAAAALVTVGGILYLQHLVHPDDTPSREFAVFRTREPPTDYSRMPDLAWLGWVGAGTGMVVISVIRAVFPSHAVRDLAFGDSRLGTLFFLLSFTQAVTGLVLCRSRLWMYRALPVSAVGVLGVAGTACLAFGSSAAVLGAGVVLFGVYSGSFFFYLVFHALAHPVRSAFYVAINEAVVGVSGIIGSVAGGVLADRYGFTRSASAGAAAVLAVTVFQVVVHRRAVADQSPGN